MDKVRGIIMPMILVWLLMNVSIASAQGSKVKTLFTVKNSRTIAPPCVSDVIHNKKMRDDSNYRKRHEDMERMIQQATINGTADRMGILTIPLVVHVIHTGEQIGTGSNISDAQILSAVTALNEDYRKIAGSNGDGAGVDCEIEFCLAVRDPNDNPTTGIVRVNGSSVTDYATQGIDIGGNEQAVKNLSKWPKTEYYNIWIVNEIEDNDGGAGIQGYAYFPSAGAAVDGTVMLYNAFGTVGSLKSYTNLNRVATHEIGHGLNLYHTFEGNSCTETSCNSDGDRVCDTPPTTSYSIYCNSPACGGTQLVENYMDYTGQDCKNMFTNGQKSRMRAALTGSRGSLLTSNACTPISQSDAGLDEIIAPTGYQCDGSFAPTVVVRNFGGNTLTSLNIQYTVDGGSSVNYNFSGSILSGSAQEVQLPQVNVGMGSHTFSATVSSPNGQQDEFAGNNSVSTNFEVVSGSTLTILFREDPYGSDNHWQLTNGSGEVIASGGPYTNGNMGTEHIDELCMAEGCYEFTIYDEYGDGLIGSAYFQVTDSEQGVIVEGSSSDDFGATSFCLNNEGIGGGGVTTPVAAFSANMTSVCVGELISFTDQSTYSPTAWSWSFNGANITSATNQNPTGISYSAPGTYSVSMTATNNAGSDTETKTNYIVVGEAPVVSGMVADVTCHGSNDGAISLTVSGGSTYSWSNGSTSANVTGLIAGNYSVLVTNATGCETLKNFSVAEPGSINVLLSNVMSDVDNAGIGSCVVSVTGGQEPYTYDWSNGSLSSNLQNVQAGTYVLIITDANGCTQSETVIISNQDSANPQPPVTSFTVSESVICTGSSINFSDMSTNNPTQWLWEFEGGIPNTSTVKNPVGIRYEQAGQHSVTLTSSNNVGSNTSMVSGYIQTNAAPVVSSSVQNLSCFGMTNGIVNISLTGGTAPFNYNWSNGSVTEDLLSVAGGNYTVNVSDAIGCTTSATITIAQPNPIGYTVIGAEADSCNLGVGSIMILPYGGTPDYTVSWNDPNQQSGIALNNVSAGTYTSSITDANGCNVQLPIEIEEVDCVTTVQEIKPTDLKLYPNPINEATFNVEYFSSNAISLNLYDLRGTQISIDIDARKAGHYIVRTNDNLANGIYVLKISDGNSYITKKVAVSK